MVSSAAATVFPAGELRTAIPRSVAAGRSMLSTPTPARPTTLQPGALVQHVPGDSGGASDDQAVGIGESRLEGIASAESSTRVDLESLVFEEWGETRFGNVSVTTTWNWPLIGGRRSRSSRRRFNSSTVRSPMCPIRIVVSFSFPYPDRSPSPAPSCRPRRSGRSLRSGRLIQVTVGERYPSGAKGAIPSPDLSSTHSRVRSRIAVCRFQRASMPSSRILSNCSRKAYISEIAGVAGVCRASRLRCRDTKSK